VGAVTARAEEHASATARARGGRARRRRERKPVSDQNTCVRLRRRAVTDQSGTHRGGDHRAELVLRERDLAGLRRHLPDTMHPSQDGRPQLGAGGGILGPPLDDALQTWHLRTPRWVRGHTAIRRCSHDRRVGPRGRDRHDLGSDNCTRCGLRSCWRHPAPEKQTRRSEPRTDTTE
jgi:hypothetical protein